MLCGKRLFLWLFKHESQANGNIDNYIELTS